MDDLEEVQQSSGTTESGGPAQSVNAVPSESSTMQSMFLQFLNEFEQRWEDEERRKEQLREDEERRKEQLREDEERRKRREDEERRKEQHWEERLQYEREERERTIERIISSSRPSGGATISSAPPFARQARDNQDITTLTITW